MRYQPDEPRHDEPEKIKKHAGLYCGGTALIVLGGYSAKGWEALRDEVKPDVIIIANGANSLVQNADYWICTENLTRAHRLASMGDEDNKKFVEMFHRDAGAKTRLVSHRSISRITDENQNRIAIRRQGYELSEAMLYFSFRDYGMGLLAGWELQHKEAGAIIHVGTVGAQALHLAGILGCTNVHTIGYDLMFKSDVNHHAYDYPLYKVDKFRTEKHRINYMGVDTQWSWVESAQWLKEMQYAFNDAGLRWRDHSDGLLKAMGLECAA